MERVKHTAKKHPKLRQVFHPEPKHAVVMLDNGINLNVFQGAPKGVLGTGEEIEV